MQNTLFNDLETICSQPKVNSGAVLSECGKYRYRLWRIWDETKPFVLWVMLNPSKADATETDNTVDKITRFTKQWGYGGFYIGNLFPYRSTKPSELKRVGVSVAARDENWQHIKEMASLCGLKMLAHGNPPIKAPDIKALFHDWHYLKLTNSGNPYHPLYLKEDLKPQPLHIEF